MVSFSLPGQRIDIYTPIAVQLGIRTEGLVFDTDQIAGGCFSTFFVTADFADEPRRRNPKRTSAVIGVICG